MPDHTPPPRPYAHRIRDWVLLIAGIVLVFNEMWLRMNSEKPVSVPLMTAALTCWGLVPALRHGDKQS